MRGLRQGARALALVVLTMPAPQAAHAQASDDPNANSPSGVIYEIPLDKGRSDAAPYGGRHDKGGGGSTATGGGGSGGGGAAGEPGSGGGSAAAPATGGAASAKLSSIHSENGFGSSSQVPGVTPKSSRKGSSSGGRSGSPEAAPDAATDERRVLGHAATATPSESRGYLLMGLAAGVALGLGLAARAVTARRR